MRSRYKYVYLYLTKFSVKEINNFYDDNKLIGNNKKDWIRITYFIDLIEKYWEYYE